MHVNTLSKISLTDRKSLEGIFFIFSQLGENALQPVRVDDRPIGDGTSEGRQDFFVSLEEIIQSTGAPIDF